MSQLVHWAHRGCHQGGFLSSPPVPALRGTVLLELGRVATVGAVRANGRCAGVCLARPYRLKISELVREGANRVELTVANTLANYMSTYPSRYVFGAQTRSGLVGPVRLRFLLEVVLT